MNETQGKMEAAKVFSSTEQNLIQTIRNLENKLDKAQMKSAETTHIGRTYEAIKDKMLEVLLFFPFLMLHQFYESSILQKSCASKQWPLKSCLGAVWRSNKAIYYKQIVKMTTSV